MSFQINIKWLLVGALVCMIAGAVGWNYIRAPKKVTDYQYIPVVSRKSNVKVDPDTVDFNTTKLWAKSPIQMEYTVKEQTREYTALNVRAFDANKETREEIRVPVYQDADWKVYAGIGAGVAIATVAGIEYVKRRAR